MERNTFPIDWRAEFSALQQFIDGKGGVACIRYAGERCAPYAFVEALTSLYEAPRTLSAPNTAKLGSQSLRVDRENYKVRYLQGIRFEFVRKMKMDLPSPITSRQLLGEVNISSNNVAGHNQTIETQITYAGDNDVSLQVRRDEWIDSLCDQLEQFLQHHHLMVILMHGSNEDQQEFWSALWHGGMSRLVDHGLFLARMINTNDIGLIVHHHVAAPDCEISLPAEFSHDQQDDAVEDLSKLIARWFPDYSGEKCQDIASGFAIGHADNIGRFHDRLLTLFLTLKTKSGPSCA